MTPVRGLPRVAVARPARTAPRDHFHLSGRELETDQRHLLQLTERKILCACESCVALRSGDPGLRPSSQSIAWLEGFRLRDDRGKGLAIPIGPNFLSRDLPAEKR